VGVTATGYGRVMDRDVSDYPMLRQVVLDCPDARALAEFYRQLLGYAYRPGDELPPAGQPDPNGEDWLVLRPEPDAARSGRGLAFQQVAAYEPPVWSADGPDPARQRQMSHLDMTVDDLPALGRQRDRAVALGATILLDRSDDEDEPLYVFADPAGHPFCIFVA
jgi:catechol 2,3-dioxygenase-like lactoylglutathione lyase family enzyme